MGAAGATRPLPRIWIDCDDLIRHFDGWSTPTGICRVQLEIIPHLLALAPDRIILCRIGRSANDLRILPRSIIEGLRQRSASSSSHTTLMHMIARALRFALLRSSHRAMQLALRAGFIRTPTEPEPGDWLLAMGGTWSNPAFADAGAALKAKYGIKLAHLVHDLLPVTDPDLVADRHVARFARWIHDIGPLSDCFLTPSRHAAKALTHHLLQSRRPEVPVTSISFGAGFSVMGGSPSRRGLPAQPYVLFVSTIEVRKNHLFLARVWERLIRKHGSQAIPSLLLIGRYGWKTKPFARFLQETAHLGGKIVVRSSMSDAELDRSYAECLFTLFPSLAEGWGLPVSESLAHGKACIASHATSIPEVGGDAVDYFDPNDEASAMDAVERMLFEKGYRESREEWIRVHFQPMDWAETAAEILDALSREDAREPLHADR